MYCKINKFDYIVDDTYANCLGSLKLGINSIWMRTKQNKNIPNNNDMYEANDWETIDKIVQANAPRKVPIL